MKENIIQHSKIKENLKILFNHLVYDKCFVLTDENTSQWCFPLIESISDIQRAKKIVVPAGDKHKNVKTLVNIWQFLSNNCASRRSLFINLGGGMISDLGGFAAATFKRGIPFINIPTTLLGAVDAAIGGKTGINFCGLKNEVGSFHLAQAVLIDSIFFQTLDTIQLLSGYAEMLKHSLLDSSKSMQKLLHFEIGQKILNIKDLNQLVTDSIQIKERIVKQDPHEQNIRKALNFGHTFGHAFESLSHEMTSPITHGWAIAWGMICELYLSHILLEFPQNEFTQIIQFIKKHYGKFVIDYSKYDKLIEWMRHDKKNESEKIHFTLLSSIGKIQINHTASEEEIKRALDFFKDFIH